MLLVISRGWLFSNAYIINSLNKYVVYYHSIICKRFVPEHVYILSVFVCMCMSMALYLILLLLHFVFVFVKYLMQGVDHMGSY